MVNLKRVLFALSLVLVSCGAQDEVVTPTATVVSLTSGAPTTTATSAQGTESQSTTSVVASTAPTPTTAAPTTADVTTTTLAAVVNLRSGMFCRDLAALGYDYEAAVAYWTAEGRPGRMDADVNGIPCQTVYAGAEVLAHWGDPLPVTFSNQFAFLQAMVQGTPTTITVDYAQWFFDDDATRAAAEDGAEEPANMWYVRNVNPSLRTLSLSDDVVIILGTWHSGAGPGPECVDATAETISAARLEDHPTWGCVVAVDVLADVIDSLRSHETGWYLMTWLVVEGGTVTAIQEQYVP